MKSISCSSAAEEVLARCLAGSPPKTLPRCLLEEACAPALFRIIVEGLADRFEPALCSAYARLFASAIHFVNPEWDVPSLVARYQRVRRPRPIIGKPRRIFVLSRVTLGADVAVTSVLLAALKRRFPRTEIILAGPRKNYELFAADRQIQHAPLEYRRGSLAERLQAGYELRRIVEEPGSIVIDPDSRLTQLGMLPVCAEEAYYLFESRAYGAETDLSLPELAARWAEEIIGVPGAKPFVALGRIRHTRRKRPIAISLGVGENPAKRIPGVFERELLTALSRTGTPLYIDKGAGGSEGERVESVLFESGVKATVWEGSFAGFARVIAASSLYVGYDSAGQHVAAACGIPLISIFAGFPVHRMFDRWRPKGEASRVIRVEQQDPKETLAAVEEALSASMTRRAPRARVLLTENTAS